MRSICVIVIIAFSIIAHCMKSQVIPTGQFSETNELIGANSSEDLTSGPPILVEDPDVTTTELTADTSPKPDIEIPTIEPKVMGVTFQAEANCSLAYKPKPSEIVCEVVLKRGNPYMFWAAMVWLPTEICFYCCHQYGCNDEPECTRIAPYFCGYLF